MIALPIETLERVFAFDHGNDALAVLRGLLLADHHEVAIIDVAVDHRLAFDLKHKRVRSREHLMNIESLILRFGGQGRAGGDETAEWQARPHQDAVHGQYGPSSFAFTRDKALLLKSFQVTHHPVGR